MNGPSDTDRPLRFCGLRAAWSMLLRELNAARRHVVGCRRARGMPLKGTRLNVGSGKYPLPGWVNADLFAAADLSFDIRERWPIPDSQVEVVRMEHVLEHVDYPLPARHVLAECIRVLRPGGVVRVGLPDTASVLRAYVEGPQARYFANARERWHPREVRLPIEHVNFHFRERFGEHRYAYDVEVLSTLLHSAGFVNIEMAAFDAGIDRADREDGTIRMCGTKPGTKEPRS